MARVPKGPNVFFRLSPAERIKANAFGLLRGEVKGRYDVNYWRLTPWVQQRLGNPRFPIQPLGNLVTKAQYGSSALAHSLPIGVPIIRMNNLQNEGWDLSDLKYIVMSERELETYRLEPGDILFNRTNSKELVGKCEVFQETGDWVFASYLIRVRTNEDLLLPQFASDFLGTEIGRTQINRLSRQIIGMTNINAEEIRELSVPSPPVEKQQALVAAMDKERGERRKKLAEADALLADMHGFLLDALGLKPPSEDGSKVFAVRLADAQAQRRLNSDYYHPERINALRALETATANIRIEPLANTVTFERTQIKFPTENYLSLAHVQSNSGELVSASEQAAGPCFTYSIDDVLFARLRPYLNKVYRAEINGRCSPEFHVLRVRDANSLMPDYLAAILRSRLVLAQTFHMMTGNTHPRLANDDVANLRIPIPRWEMQQRIANEVQRRRKEARRLREGAEAGWQAAKRRFEEQLLGPTG